MSNAGEISTAKQIMGVQSSSNPPRPRLLGREVTVVIVPIGLVGPRQLVGSVDSRVCLDRCSRKSE
eukprot:9481976-Pyramimonas_sp.AAC.1